MKAAIVLLLAVGVAFSGSTAKAADECTSSGGIQFICGPSRSEDLALVPHTHWIIASGAHLYLINADSKTWEEAYPGANSQTNQDKTHYAGCPGAPDAKQLITVGLSIRSRSRGISTLYAVGRGGRDAVEIFQVDASRNQPEITWIGCVMMPKGSNANAVAALPDGFLVTSTIEAGHTREEAFSGQVSGAVYEWHAGGGIHLIPGTELSGNNGIESSPDGKQFYVNATGGRSVTRFIRARSGLKSEKVDLDFGPDNIHWGQNGRLFISGRADEAACGGTMAARNGKLDSDCPRGFEVVTLDPKTMKVQFVVRTKPDPAFNAWSTALQLGDEIWIPGTRCDRIGYFSLR